MIRRGAALLCLLSCSGCISNSLGAPADILPGCGSPDDCRNGAVCLEDGSCQTTGCGNGEVDVELDEECDTGGRNGTDREECTKNCVRRRCGDLTVDADLGEHCDGPDCKLGCRVPALCGDAELDGNEACDDGNLVPGDGCDEDCSCSGPTAISTIWHTVLALRGDGAVFAWGYLPEAVVTEQPTHDPVHLDLPPAVEIAAGDRLAAIRTGDGHVFVLDSENADGGFDGDPATQRPLELQGSYSRIAAGLDHLLLLDADGNVSAIGSNSSGQAGVGRTGGRLRIPEPVTLERDAVEIAAGKYVSLAILDGGDVWAWGSSQLAETGAVLDHVETPQPVAGLSGCDRLRTSGLTSFARCNGAWWGWGWDEFGQLETATGVAPARCGDGTACNPAPALLELPFVLAELSVGQDAVYALDDEGAVWGWGQAKVDDLSWDALGRGGREQVLRTPTLLSLPLPGPYAAVAGGFYFGLAIHGSGRLFTTGSNEGGALGRPPEVGTGLNWLEAATFCNAP